MMGKNKLHLALVLLTSLAVGCRKDVGEVSAVPGHAPEPASQAGSTAQPLAGSKTCRDCHEEFYQLWATSWHGLAMQPYTPELSRSKLTAQAVDVTIGKRRYRAEIGAGAGWVRQQGPEGEKKYPIAHVMGGKNVYYFLSPLQRGRLQVLPVAYDVHKKAWYDTAASGVRHFPDRRDEALDWTDRLFTFNTTCFNCHVSQLATNYDFSTDSYHTTWAEPGISCESCHGPAGEHVRAMEAAPKDEQAKDIKIIRTRDFTAEQMSDMCATCHAKMVPLSLSFTPGDKFFDHYDLVTLEHSDFYPDGRDLGENYTHTSWLMSPCLKSGKLDCNHCHTPSGRMRFDGEKANECCLPCHEKEVKGAVEHGHHPPGSKGNECIGCHMPMTRFAAMGRSDHSMRPPMPAATLAFKSPNACNLCHTDQDAAWSETWVRQWYKGNYQVETVRRGGLIDAARKLQWNRLAEMLAELGAKEDNPIYKTSLVRLVRACPDQRVGPALLRALGDPSPLVRSAAASALGDHPTPEVIKELLAATRDPSRLVRIRSAMALAAVAPDTLAEERDRQSLGKAIAEFKTAMQARPDDWASYANLGNFYMEGRQFHEAVKCFETSYQLEPRSIGPMVNAAIAYSNMNRNEDAERCLRRALEAEPANAAANFNLGLLLGEQGRLEDAEQALRLALKSDPRMAAAAYNLGVIVAKKNLDEALLWCRKAHELRPDDPKYAHTLAFYQREKGDTQSAIQLLREVIRRQPAYLDAYLLLADIYEGKGDNKAAAEVYREALKRQEVPPAAKRQLEAKLLSLERATPAEASP